ncbi:hypothetical protein C2845_PM08G17750 [Panicum miliaceum]|uniref:Uncharacterized protein n=1 Tax=Panicum miliaceum TaxID=4540 RepID=A0A3L6R0H2_PANMI|nr:hypothetical protein C2845_PM08G17750 [Panicum miliaceum]
MGIGGGTAALLAAAAAAVVVAVSVPSSPAAGWTAAAAAEEDQGGRRPCFHACFDQCVPRDEFWFCQLSCYHRCAGAGYRAIVPVAPGRHPGCEQSCALSLCGRLRPGSKVMAACRDTCRKSYAVAACRGGA